MDSPELSSKAQAITLEQLQVFSAIAESGSFSAAARALRKTQGGISYHVACLEEQLEVSLFDRSGRLPKLTTAGEAMLAHARRVLAELNAMRGASLALASGLEPRLFVSINVLFPRERLAAILAEFRAGHPSVDLSVRIPVTRTETADALRDGQADLAIISYLDRSDEFVLEPCTSIELLPLVSRNHPLAGKRTVPDEELQRHVHLMLSEDPRPEVEDVLGFPSTRRWRVNEECTRLELVRAGVGWARLERSLVEADLRTGRLVPLRAKRFGGRPALVDLYVARMRNRPLGPAGQWLWQRLSGLAGEAGEKRVDRRRSARAAGGGALEQTEPAKKSPRATKTAKATSRSRKR